MKLEHLAPYLPYGLKLKHTFGEVTTLIGLLYEPTQDWHVYQVAETKLYRLPGANKPILRHLSDLTKEIEHNEERFVPVDYFNQIIDRKRKVYFDMLIELGDAKTARYDIVQKLFEWHFDVFGLIEQGKAIDINTIKETA